MQPQARHHSSQHARPQSTSAHEQINKKSIALASSAAHLRVKQAKRKTTQASQSLASSQQDSAAASFQNHFGSAWPTPSLAAHGAFGEQSHCRDSRVGQLEDGKMASCTKDAQGPTTSRGSSWTWHRRTVTLLHQLSHSQQVINTGKHLSMPFISPLSLIMGLASRAAPR